MYFNWLTDNSAVLSIILAAIPILWGAFSYINIKNKEAKDRQFVIYHDLIRKLVEPEKTDSVMYVDRQRAVIFELRFFKKYYPLTLRILKSLRETWKNKASAHLILQELDITIEFLGKKVKDQNTLHS